MSTENALPRFNYHGYLPEGVHDTTFAEIEKRLVTNPRRVFLWEQLQAFLKKAVATGEFACVYIDGGFVTEKNHPEDVDVILQTCAAFSPEAFRAMEPFFAEGMDTILKKYSVHLHFWCEGFPGGMSDFRHFFQYLRPQEGAPKGLREGAKKGIVRGAL